MSQSIAPILSCYKGTLQELHQVQTNYGGGKDFLSLKMCDWIKTLPSESQLRSLTTEQIKNRVKTKLGELFSEILVNPFHAALPLREPVLDGPWTWERLWLENYRTHISPISPLTKKPFETTNSVHSFVVKMIAWASKLAELQEITPSSGTLVVGSNSTPRNSDEDPISALVVRNNSTPCTSLNPSGDPVVEEQTKKCLIAFFNLLAEYAIRIQSEWDKKKYCEAYTQQLKKVSVQLEKDYAAQKVESAQRKHEFETSVEESLKATEESLRREREAMQAHLVQLAQEERAAQAQLNESRGIEARLDSEAAAARRRT